MAMYFDNFFFDGVEKKQQTSISIEGLPFPTKKSGLLVPFFKIIREMTAVKIYSHVFWLHLFHKLF